MGINTRKPTASSLLKRIREAEGEDPGDMWLQDSKTIADLLIAEHGDKDSAISAVNSYMSSKGDSLSAEDKARLEETINFLNVYFDVPPPLEEPENTSPNTDIVDPPVVEHWSKGMQKIEGRKYPDPNKKRGRYQYNK